jgi:hypothetical protein
MLLAERIVNPVLELDVRADFAGTARRRVHFHNLTLLVTGRSRHGASGGFCGTTYEIMRAPSFEIERLVGAKKKELNRRKRS